MTESGVVITARLVDPDTDADAAWWARIGLQRHPGTIIDTLVLVVTSHEETAMFDLPSLRVVDDVDVAATVFEVFAQEPVGDGRRVAVGAEPVTLWIRAEFPVGRVTRRVILIDCDGSASHEVAVDPSG